MMMGSSEQAIKDVSEVINDPSVINDFEEEIAQQLSTEYREEYLNKVSNRVKSYEVKILNEHNIRFANCDLQSDHRYTDRQTYI